MSTVDIILGCILIWGTIQGVRQGFFSALTSFVAYFIGIYAAIKLSSVLAKELENFVSWEPKTIEIAAFALTFVGVVLLLFFTAKIFTKIADWAYLGWINSLFGGLFGLLKYTLFLGVLLVFFNKINSNSFFLSDKEKQESIFYSKIEYTAELIFPSLQKWFNELKDSDLISTDKENEQ